jgi:hypothetical protein
VVLLVVWIALAVVVLGLLGGLAYGLLGAFGQLARELGRLDEGLRPALAELQAGLARAEQLARAARERLPTSR